MSAEHGLYRPAPGAPNTRIRTAHNMIDLEPAVAQIGGYRVSSVAQRKLQRVTRVTVARPPGSPTRREPVARVFYADWCVQIADSGHLVSSPAGLLLKGGGFARIFGPDGRPLAEPLPEDAEGILYAECDFTAIAIAKSAADPAGHYSRPDVTRLLLNRELARRPVVETSAPPLEPAVPTTAAESIHAAPAADGIPDTASR